MIISMKFFPFLSFFLFLLIHWNLFVCDLHHVSVSIGSSLNGIYVRDVISIESPSVLCPWDSPGKDTGVGGPALLQGIFPTQGSNPCHLQILYTDVISTERLNTGALSGKILCGPWSRDWGAGGLERL